MTGPAPRGRRVTGLAGQRHADGRRPGVDLEGQVAPRLADAGLVDGAIVEPDRPVGGDRHGAAVRADGALADAVGDRADAGARVLRRERDDDRRDAPAVAAGRGVRGRLRGGRRGVDGERAARRDAGVAPRVLAAQRPACRHRPGRPCPIRRAGSRRTGPGPRRRVCDRTTSPAAFFTFSVAETGSDRRAATTSASLAPSAFGESRGRAPVERPRDRRRGVARREPGGADIAVDGRAEAGHGEHARAVGRGLGLAGDPQPRAIGQLVGRRRLRIAGLREGPEQPDAARCDDLGGAGDHEVAGIDPGRRRRRAVTARARRPRSPTIER